MRAAIWGLVLIAMAGSALAAEAPATQPLAARSYGDYATELQRSWSSDTPRTEQHLKEIVNRLRNPATHMTAMRELIDFAGESLYMHGSIVVVYQDHSEKIRVGAAKIVGDAADNPTILAALNGNDPILVFWGLRHFTALKDSKEAIARVEILARGPDESLRVEAVEFLRNGRQFEFVKQLVATEKSPGVLDQILFAGRNIGAKAMNQRLCALMADPDPKVRKAVVDYIGWNCMSASGRQLFIDADIMRSLLICALEGGLPSDGALADFRQYSNQDNLPTVRAALQWWGKHRLDWELDRFPRGEQSNGGWDYFASIVTSGAVGAKDDWHASVIFKNTSKHDIFVSRRDISAVQWSLFDESGRYILTLDKNQNNFRIGWVDLAPQQSFEQPLPISLKTSPPLAAGRYQLKAYFDMGMEQIGRPVSGICVSGQLPLPVIEVEVVDAAK